MQQFGPPSSGNTLRFLHVHTFYPQATEQLYERDPRLKDRSFIEQMETVLADGFSAAHIFTPYLPALGYESHFIVADNPYAQAKWLQENQLTIEDQQDWVKQILRKQIEVIKPDVLYTCNTILFDSHFINSLAHRPQLVMGWRGADISDSTDWSSYDVILSGLPLLRERALEIGAKQTEDFFPGYPTRLNKHIAYVEPRFDVVFSGSWTSRQHSTRNRYLEAVARAATEPQHAFSCAFYLGGEVKSLPQDVARYTAPPQFGLAMHRALRKGRIVLDARADHRFYSKGEAFDMAGEDTVNMRIFEATGSGAFLLTQHLDNLDRYFEPEKEIATYRNEKELIEKIRYYLDRPAERQAIARRGQERCLRMYSMKERALEFDRIIRKHLKKTKAASSIPTSQPAQREKEVTTAKTPLSIESLLRTAIDTFREEKYEDAFRFISQAKAMRQPVPNIDYLRAACLLHLGKPIDAREALREELHYFPTNTNAQQLLKEVLAVVPDTHQIEDEEFQATLAQIRPHTMIPEARLYSLFTLVKAVCEQDIPGDIVECGVARGGSMVMMGMLVEKYSKRPRRIYGFDSFEGMPEPTEFDAQNGVPADETGWGTGTCAASVESVQALCEAHGVAQHITLVKGYFEDTLHEWTDQIGPIAFLHLDADWYSSTMSILNNFYDQVTPGGLMQFDDYGCWDGCHKAVEEYQQLNQLTFALQPMYGDHQGRWMQKKVTLVTT